MARRTIHIRNAPPGWGVRYKSASSFVRPEAVSQDPPSAANDTFAPVYAGSSSITLNPMSNDTGAETIVSVTVDVGSVSRVQSNTRLSYTPPASVTDDTTATFTITVDNEYGQDVSTATILIRPEPDPIESGALMSTATHKQLTLDYDATASGTLYVTRYPWPDPVSGSDMKNGGDNPLDNFEWKNWYARWNFSVSSGQTYNLVLDGDDPDYGMYGLLPGDKCYIHTAVETSPGNFTTTQVFGPVWAQDTDIKLDSGQSLAHLTSHLDEEITLTVADGFGSGNYVVQDSTTPSPVYPPILEISGNSLSLVDGTWAYQDDLSIGYMPTDNYRWSNALNTRKSRSGTLTADGSLVSNPSFPLDISSYPSGTEFQYEQTFTIEGRGANTQTSSTVVK